jgi:DNA topoisomerase-1
MVPLMSWKKSEFSGARNEPATFRVIFHMKRPPDEPNHTSHVVADPATDGPHTAEAAGLVYVSDDELTIHRKPAGKGFTYLGPSGTTIHDRAELKRIRALAIPPAWTDVRICPNADGHIQATGRDAKGRKQYRYHPRWREVRDGTKYEHMLAFAEALPTIRARIADDMARRDFSREKVLATIVSLLETTLIRVGNSEYAEHNKSYGLTTLRNRHAVVDGTELRFEFKGKSGKTWRLKIHDRRIAKIIKACQSIPGQHLFQYFDEAGERHQVTSSDVNAYLREITGADITAKDFRTWAGTVLAAMELREIEAFDSATKAKRNLKSAIEKVSERLGNTVAICRKCYVHPEVVDCYFEGTLPEEIGKAEHAAERVDSGLHAEETAVLVFLKHRLARAARSFDKGT